MALNGYPWGGMAEKVMPVDADAPARRASASRRYLTNTLEKMGTSRANDSTRERRRPSLLTGALRKSLCPRFAAAADETAYQQYIDKFWRSGADAWHTLVPLTVMAAWGCARGWLVNSDAHLTAIRTAAAGVVALATALCVVYRNSISSQVAQGTIVLAAACAVRARRALQQLPQLSPPDGRRGPPAVLRPSHPQAVSCCSSSTSVSMLSVAVVAHLASSGVPGDSTAAVAAAMPVAVTLAVHLAWQGSVVFHSTFLEVHTPCDAVVRDSSPCALPRGDLLPGRGGHPAAVARVPLLHSKKGHVHARRVHEVHCFVS